MEPIVVNINTHVAKIGYDFERSLKLNTRSQIIKERPYNIKPISIKGLKAAFDNSKITLAFSPLTPPKEITPFFSSKFAVTFKVTLTTRS